MVARSTAETPLVTADWLKTHLGAPDVRVLDASWFMPDAGQTGRRIYDAHHIPGARFFDIDDIADADSPYPHMLPPAEKFASRARKLGLGDGHRIVCYDQNGYFASCRAWWMFRAMGHDDVAVLDGGFNAWRTAGGAVEDLPPAALADRHFTVRSRGDLVRNFEQMQAIIAKGGAQIVDARPAARFKGEAEEPRPGLKRGHMPGALNLPHGQVIAADGRFKSPEELRHVFIGAGVDLKKPIVNSCGSGVTAAILAFAEALAGHDDAAVYDAAWCEWGLAASTAPVATG
jgi:thiosulfate/3-mercaptopyruvate sulfurtransferase